MKNQNIRNIKSFVRAYLKGPNGQRNLGKNKPLAAAFAKAVQS